MAAPSRARPSHVFPTTLIWPNATPRFLNLTVANWKFDIQCFAITALDYCRSATPCYAMSLWPTPIPRRGTSVWGHFHCLPPRCLTYFYSSRRQDDQLPFHATPCWFNLLSSPFHATSYRATPIVTPSLTWHCASVEKSAESTEINERLLSYVQARFLER